MQPSMEQNEKQHKYLKCIGQIRYCNFNHQLKSFSKFWKMSRILSIFQVFLCKKQKLYTVGHEILAFFKRQQLAEQIQYENFSEKVLASKPFFIANISRCGIIQIVNSLTVDLDLPKAINFFIKALKFQSISHIIVLVLIQCPQRVSFINILLSARCNLHLLLAMPMLVGQQRRLYYPVDHVVQGDCNKGLIYQYFWPLWGPI
eukprot:TRINITY_DN153_c1_g1_i10.p2 TRINITY_DN153_c1_g1~~TRINITY_DN153_c1_g1_i10.p2  ORF type:complete len:219 (+),score=-9.53 TRINITY_DN153_c1_g1_i10:49-657(+)